MNKPAPFTPPGLTTDYFSKSIWRPLLFWPLVCLLLGSLLWGYVLARARSDLELVDSTTLRDAASYAIPSPG